MDKYNNKYRIHSTRLQHWDYGWNGHYFITTCCKNRVHYFGDINNGEMQLSAIGIIANVLWYEIKNHAKHIAIDAFIVMPNHIHGIIILDNGDRDTKVETRHALSLQSSPSSSSIGKKRFQKQGTNTISSIIGSYKSAVSKHAHRLNFDFAWQPRFYDHIIRDEKSYQQIAHYIKNNPMQWDTDKLNGGIGNQVMEQPSDYGLPLWLL